jgi:4,5-DOPA dioxygenase extradiol
MLPALFISHGAPTLAVEDGDVTRAWAALARELPRPREILVVSAHWDTTEPQASTAPRPETLHDFFGFPRSLYEERYEPPGAPRLAERAAGELRANGIACALDPLRGLDHGAWVPLKWMYPQADIPVTQLSVQSPRGTRHHHALGRAIAALRGDDLLILASGGIVHNLRELEWHLRGQTQAVEWARSFNEWIASRVEDRDEEALIDYRRAAPHGARSHPTEEHFDPFFVALGAGGFPARRLDLGFEYGTLGMDAYLFGQ